MSQWNTSQCGKKSARSSDGEHADGVTKACLQFVDLGIGAIIFVGPHLLGGRHPLGRFAIVVACVATAVAWFIGQCFTRHSKWQQVNGLGVLVLAVGIVTLQLVPLSEEWLAVVSPRTSEILPLWHADSPGLKVGKWNTISLSPEDTRLALATLIGYAMLFVTAAQRLKSIDDVKRIVQWTGWSAVIVAAFGIVQYLTANGKFFWIYEYPYTDTLQHLKAGFTCRNHFAHFLVLGTCCLLASKMVSRRDGHSPPLSSRPNLQEIGKAMSNRFANRAHGASITILVFAVLASLSRGAALALVIAVAVMAVCFAAVGMLRTVHALAAGAFTLILMIALSLSGDYDHVTGRLGSFTTASLDDLDESGGRRLIWSANLAAFRAGWMTGSGAGSHRFVYPIYIKEPFAREFTHAESGYLQIASENGLPGVLLLICALGLCCYWCYSAMRLAGDNRTMFILAVGVGGALTASMAHSAVDFVWFIPACACVTILLIACAMRLAQLAAAQHFGPATSPNLHSVTRFNMAFCALLAGIWAIVTLYPAARTAVEWDGYLLADQAVQITTAQRAGSATLINELDPAPQLSPDASLSHLANVVRAYPRCARAHARLASNLLGRFEFLQQQCDNQMSISQIREAAAASNFASPNELHQWLERAFGENCRLLYQARYHARRAIALCPLLGEAYVYLAELSFLADSNFQVVEAYSNQGLLVRPQDPDVLFAVGKRYLIEGKMDQALSLWRMAYRGEGNHQYLINRILAHDMKPFDFIRFFQPTWTPLLNLWVNYRESGQRENLKAILPYASRIAAQEVASLTAKQGSVIWWSLADMQKDLALQTDAEKSLQMAHAANPDHFYIRYDLAKCLVDLGRYELAEPHLRWCLARSPDDKTLRSALLHVSRTKMQRLAKSSSGIQN